MNVLWIPIFSMRSYETGKYSILKDGNFQLTMARALASDFDHITMVLPDDASDYQTFLYQIRNLTKGRFTALKLKYGANAVETREQFWDLNRKELTSRIDKHQQFDLIISDITGYNIEPFHPVPIIYNFNITKLPELNRPYIDKFFEADLKSIEQSLFTTVINPRQRDYIVEVRPDLADKVIAHTKVAHRDLLPEVPRERRFDFNENTIFWPFRISDKAYLFNEFITAFEQYGLDSHYNIIVTDPNDSLKDEKPYITKIKPSKEAYYEMLAGRPIVVMLDDIDTVLHPGTIEIFHYGCPMITFTSKLIYNANAIDDFVDLPIALSNIERPVALPTQKDFVYQNGEVDQYYNKDFIRER